MFKYTDFKNSVNENTNNGHQVYLRQIDIQWQAIHREAHNQIQSHQPVTALLDCIHYALVMSSIHSWRADIHEDYEEQYYAIDATFSLDTPNLADVLDYLENDLTPKISPFNQVLSYSKLANSTEQKSFYLNKVDHLLENIRDDYQKAFALLQRAKIFTELIDIQQSYAQIETIAQQINDNWQQANLYISIAQLDGYPNQSKASEIALEKANLIDDPYFRMSTLASLRRQLPLADQTKSELLASMQNTLPQIKSTRPRLQAMYHLYQVASAEQQAEMVQAVLHAFDDELSTEYAKLGVIQYYGRVFTGKPREQLLTIARGFENQMYRARALAVFLPDLDITDKQTIQRDILDYLVHLSTRSRSQTLSLFMRRELFGPQIWGEQITRQIAQVISQTCTDWYIQA